MTAGLGVDCAVVVVTSLRKGFTRGLHLSPMKSRSRRGSCSGGGVFLQPFLQSGYLYLLTMAFTLLLLSSRIRGSSDESSVGRSG